MLTDQRFAGKTRSEWREWYGNRLRAMREELEQARGTVERGKRGGNIPIEEIRRAHANMRDLERRIELDEQAVVDLEHAK